VGKDNFDGVINLETVLRGPIVATNGHYMDVSDDFNGFNYRTSQIWNND